MKKASPEARDRIVRLNNKKRHQLKAAQSVSERAKQIHVYAPKYVDLYIESNHHKLQHLISKIRQATNEDNAISINFDETESISAAAMLLLIAEVDRANELCGRRIVSCSYPKALKVEQILQQVGFLRLTGKKHRLTESEFPHDVRFWRFESGSQVDLRSAERFFNSLFELIPGMIDSGIFRGISEAITNAHQHAYLPEFNQRFKIGKTRWWLFGEVKDDVLALVVCDLGLGIPFTLPNKHKNFFTNFLAGLGITKFGDATCIKAAMEFKASRTNSTHRGKGLHDLQWTVKDAGVGCLRILSRKGEYQFNSPKPGMEFETVSRDRVKSVGGTIIEWNLPISALVPDAPICQTIVES